MKVGADSWLFWGMLRFIAIGINSLNNNFNIFNIMILTITIPTWRQ